MIDISSILASLDLSFVQQPPNATIFILALTALLNLITSLISRYTTDLTEYRRIMEESQYARQELMSAMKTENKRKIARAQKKQQDINQKQLQMSSSRMKTMMLVTLPVLLLWPTLGNLYGNTLVAFMPFNAPWVGTKLYFVNWYVLTSITSNIIFQRIFKITFEIDPKETS
jgi:uncharacterized membrane protein (DUF106 family)